MTIKEAILSNNILSDFEGNHLERVLVSRSINGREAYSSSSLKSVELVTADLYSDLLVSPEFKEGALSIKHDKGELKSYILKIAKKYDDESLLNIFPGIENSNEW